MRFIGILIYVISIIITLSMCYSFDTSLSERAIMALSLFLAYIGGAMQQYFTDREEK